KLGWPGFRVAGAPGRGWRGRVLAASPPVGCWSVRLAPLAVPPVPLTRLGQLWSVPPMRFLFVCLTGPRNFRGRHVPARRRRLGRGLPGLRRLVVLLLPEPACAGRMQTLAGAIRRRGRCLARLARVREPVAPPCPWARVNHPCCLLRPRRLQCYWPPRAENPWIEVLPPDSRGQQRLPSRVGRPGLPARPVRHLPQRPAA